MTTLTLYPEEIGVLRECIHLMLYQFRQDIERVCSGRPAHGLTLDILRHRQSRLNWIAHLALNAGLELDATRAVEVRNLYNAEIERQG